METENNKKKKKILFRKITETFERVLKKGFYGRVGFRIFIQDGAIQDVEKEEIEKYRAD